MARCSSEPYYEVPPPAREEEDAKDADGAYSLREEAADHAVRAAVATFAAGGMVLVADDEDREDEGDLIVAAELVTEAQVTARRCPPSRASPLARLPPRATMGACRSAAPCDPCHRVSCHAGRTGRCSRRPRQPRQPRRQLSSAQRQCSRLDSTRARRVPA